MLSIQYIKQHQQKVIQKLLNRNIEGAHHMVAQLLSVNSQRKQQQQKVDVLRSALKKQAEQIGRLIQQGSRENAARAKEKMLREKSRCKEELEQLKAYVLSMRSLLLSMPNLPDDDVPVGKSSKDNKVVKEWQGTVPKGNSFPHWMLAKKHDIIDFELGNKVTGAGFPVYKGKGAQFQRALINFFLAEAGRAGYQEIAVPVVVNEASALGTGQLPDKEGMMYALQEKNMYLIPTAEVPLTNLYRDALLYAKDLPIRMVGYTPCFRREAGSWGRDVRGLNRLHQFDKVEAVMIVTPAQAAQALQRMYDYVSGLLQSLGLTYRVLKLCTGDLGFAAAITYDFEVWSAGQQKWLEVSSVSCFNDYQARRMNLRYRTANKPQYCYTINGSALALPRVVAALLENYQKEDCIAVPKPLQQYTRFSKI